MFYYIVENCQLDDADRQQCQITECENRQCGLSQITAHKCFTYLELQKSGDFEEEGESAVVEAFQKCASSLQSHKIDGINELKRLSERTGLEHFTALDGLTFHYLEDEGDDNTMFWKSFPQNLRSLQIKDCYRMTSLPKGVQYLTSLQNLYLTRCENLNSLPEWISSLSSLQSLTIWYCPALKSLPEAMRNLTSLQRLVILSCTDLIERCEEPNGQDYPKIKHILDIA